MKQQQPGCPASAHLLTPAEAACPGGAVAVDLIVVLSENTPLSLLEMIRPTSSSNPAAEGCPCRGDARPCYNSDDRPARREQNRLEIALQGLCYSCGTG